MSYQPKKFDYVAYAQSVQRRNRMLRLYFLLCCVVVPAVLLVVAILLNALAN